MTRARDVVGISVTPLGMRKARITVRMTVDKKGASMSLSVGGTMLSIPTEAVKTWMQDWLNGEWEGKK